MRNRCAVITSVLAQLLLLSHVVWGQTQTCQSDGPCRCVMSDGSGVVDISSIGNMDGSSRFPEYPGYDANMFSYNPCFPSAVQLCQNAAVCQLVNGSFVNIGSQDSAQWSLRVQYPVVTYTSEAKKTEVMLICDANFTNPQLTVIGQFPSGTVGMMLTSKCACPGGCAGVEPTTNSIQALSPGYVALIIFSSLLGVYFIFGTGFNYARHGKSCTESVPNYAFWSSLPGNIQEGFRFTKHFLCCFKDGNYQPI